MFPSTDVINFIDSTHVETVVLLSREKADDHIRFFINTVDLKQSVGGYATYGDIKTYLLEKFGLKASSLNIDQTKDKCVIKERENYNKGRTYESCLCFYKFPYMFLILKLLYYHHQCQSHLLQRHQTRPRPVCYQHSS